MKNVVIKRINYIKKKKIKPPENVMYLFAPKRYFCELR